MGVGNWQVVAVKQLDRNGLQGNREFLVEVLMLSLLHHPNLVNLIGYCADGDQRLLVYEFMPLGCLEDHLHGKWGRGLGERWRVGLEVRRVESEVQGDDYGAVGMCRLAPRQGSIGLEHEDEDCSGSSEGSGVSAR